jgi:hypothetical protein
MSRSRQIVFASLGVLVAGVAVAVGARAFGSAAAQTIGPLPVEALVLPGDAPFLAGVDVKRLVATELYKSKMALATATRPEGLKELEDKTGINPERDVDQLVIAGGKDARAGVGVVLGRFDEYKLGRAIEAKPGVRWEKHEGVTVYSFDEGTAKDPRAVAFLDNRVVIFGSPSLVKATITNRSRGSAGLRANSALGALLLRVKPGSTFWMVGDQSVLANMPTSLPAPGAAAGSGSSLTLPALKSVIVTGDLEPQVALSVTGDTADEAAAKNLADVVRGLVALAAMQAQQKPELQQLAQAFSVTTSANQVQVSFRIAPGVLEALAPGKPAAVTPPAPPAAKQ